MPSCSPIYLLLTILLAIGPLSAKSKPFDKDIVELQQQIEQVLASYRVPGACVVIADRESVLWATGLGKADLATNRLATQDTLFRVGSISKIWVSLAALKLQSEGRLDLQAPLQTLAPEIRFENSWEATDPVRLVHLLEHTSGWPDLRLREHASSDPTPLTLRGGLDYDSRPRISRWRPGTRAAYSNSGPAVVAYVIQKIAGQDYEDYIAESFFKPLGMGQATFRLDPRSKASLATLYGEDGHTPLAYYHDLLRPSGALNVSAREMGKALHFLLNRGKWEGRPLLPARAMLEREKPTSGLGARSGLQVGYGLGDGAFLDENGFVWHGHSGAVPGAMARLSYLPDWGVGCFFAISGGDLAAAGKVRKLLHSFLTKDLPRPTKPPAFSVPHEVASIYNGWYRPVSSRSDQLAFLDVLEVTRFHVHGSGLSLNTPLGGNSNFMAVTPSLFRDEAHSVPSLALLPPGPAGLMVEVGGVTFKRIPGLMAWAILGIMGLFLVSLLGTGLFALVWLPRKAMGRMRAVRHLSLRVWPLLAGISLTTTVILIWVNLGDLSPLGRPGPVSYGICVLTLTFALFSALGCLKALRTPMSEVNAAVWIQSFLASGVFSLVSVYLAWHGFIGIRGWN